MEELSNWFASLTGDQRVLLGIPYLIACVYLWFKALVHMLGMVKNGKTKWGHHLAGPFSPFLPFLYTEQGNYHRVRLLVFGGAFVLCILVPFLALREA